MTPRFLYGTAWKEERTEKLTRQAIDCGFVAIDTANQRKHYAEAAVGAAIAGAIRDGVVTRDALFLQSKFTYLRGQDHRLPYDRAAPLAVQVAQSFASSLKHLQTDYLDSLLLHGPATGDRWTRPDWEVWDAMSRLQADGRVRQLGVSNVAETHLIDLLSGLSRGGVRPDYVQNRCYARTGWDREVRAVCREQGIVYQGFSLLTANRHEQSLPPITNAARRTGKTPAQIVFRFALDVAMLPITGSSDALHLKEDLAVFDFALTSAELAAIENVGV